MSDVIAKVISQKGACEAGHKVGNTFVIGQQTPPNFCSLAFYSLFPFTEVLQFSKSLAEVIDRLYEMWFETKHPNSYEQSWTPSIYTDDIFDTFGLVVSIYRHIVQDEPEGASVI